MQVPPHPHPHPKKETKARFFLHLFYKSCFFCITSTSSSCIWVLANSRTLTLMSIKCFFLSSLSFSSFSKSQSMIHFHCSALSISGCFDIWAVNLRKHNHSFFKDKMDYCAVNSTNHSVLAPQGLEEQAARSLWPTSRLLVASGLQPGIQSNQLSLSLSLSWATADGWQPWVVAWAKLSWSPLLAQPRAALSTASAPCSRRATFALLPFQAKPEGCNSCSSAVCSC